MRNNRARGKKTLFILCMVILEAAVLCVLVEGILRVFTPPWLAYRMNKTKITDKKVAYDSDSYAPKETRYINGRFVSLAPFLRKKFAAYEYLCTVNTDEYGGRLTALAPTAQKDTRIVFMGDSFLLGLGAQDAQTYVSLLGGRSPYRYLNLGVGGSTLVDQIFIIQARHKELGEPALYVFNFFIGNDFDELIRGFYPQKRNEGISSFVAGVNYLCYDIPIFKKSYCLQFIRAKLLVLYNACTHGQRSDCIFFITDRGNQEYLKKACDSFDAALKSLIEQSNRLRFKFIFVIVPDQHQIYPELTSVNAQYYHCKLGNIDTELPNRILREKLSARNIPYIDPLACFRAKGKNLYYHWDNHFTVKGHKEFADCIGPRLEEIISNMLAN